MHCIKQITPVSLLTILLTACAQDVAPPNRPNLERLEAAEEQARGSFVLKIQGLADNTSSGCLTVSSMGWNVIDTSFQASEGPPSESECILTAVHLPGESTTYFVSGDAFDIRLDTPDYDNDVVRHSISTSEDVVQLGTFPIAIGIRDRLCPLIEDEVCADEDKAKYTGSLQVVEINEVAGTITVSI